MQLLRAGILHVSGVLLRAGHQANRPAVSMNLSARFDNPDEHFSCKEVQFKTFYLPVKTSCCCAAENVNENPVQNFSQMGVQVSCGRPLIKVNHFILNLLPLVINCIFEQALLIAYFGK